MVYMGIVLGFRVSGFGFHKLGVSPNKLYSVRLLDGYFGVCRIEKLGAVPSKGVI